MLRAGLKQPLYRVEAVNQTFGIVEAVDADDETTARDTVAQPRCLASAGRAYCSRSDDRRVDADRKPRRADAGSVGPDRPVVARLPTGFPLAIVLERLQVVPGLKANEVIGKERAHEGLVHRECRQHLGRWKGNVQEKAQRVVDA